MRRTGAGLGGLLACLLSGATIAQEGQPLQCDAPSDAPDAIVGDINAAGNYYGSIGDIAAFAIGTYSCNIGTCWLNWFGTNDQHPVISQNMFRLEDGRFEHIGQSWIKHVRFALQDSLCAEPGQPCLPSDPSHLGVRCADPYGPGLNGFQPGLGPKSAVNPSTGVVDYPYPGQNQTGNLIYKRLQVHHADLEPALNPGALYFVEGMLVAEDDAAAGNQHNNASYRRITVTGTAPAFSVSSTWPTVQEQPAIRAWKDHDPDVFETSSIVDGEFIIAAKATPIAPERWQYEYAIQNLNSHRAASWFHVPAPPAVVVTAIGFHDVDYHSGDPYDLTDWRGVRQNGVVWHTGRFADDDNANALRWGTLYNFRFEADHPPRRAHAALGLFMSGDPIAVLMNTLVPLVCDDDGQCEAGEECATCPGDCNQTPDTDSDGVVDGCDNCDGVANPSQADADLDQVGDACDPCAADPINDGDADALCGFDDNCAAVANAGQSDGDADGLGDACDACPADPLNDADFDQHCGNVDVCPTVADPAQLDADGDGRGDACDNCDNVPNPAQADADADDLGDLCDACPSDAANDADGDGHCADLDNCPQLANPAQADADRDGLGDPCDFCPTDALNDTDADGVCGAVDNCVSVANPAQTDGDGDGHGDPCDNCPESNPTQANADGDALGDLCDACPNDAANDIDADGLCADQDNCDGSANPGQADGDGDGIGDPCDGCPLDPLNDGDQDGVCDGSDNCPGVSTPNQSDADADGLGDPCDACPLDPLNDPDADLVCGEIDNCPFASNPGQANSDRGLVSQWGASAFASSEYSDTEWSAMQAAGAPELGLVCEGVPSNWAPADGGADPEWIEVAYAVPVRATGAVVRESRWGGFVQRIEARDLAGALHEVWAGVDATPCGGEFAPTWPATPFLVGALRIHTAIDDWEEIDAVAMIGVSPEGQGPPTPDAYGDACDVCPQLYDPAQQPLVFGQSVRAIDADTLGWPVALDVRYVRGPLSGVAVYAVDHSGDLTAAGSLDLSTDQPAPGSGSYYLLKIPGTCGSWQSAPGAEPGRDAALP